MNIGRIEVSLNPFNYNLRYKSNRNEYFFYIRLYFIEKKAYRTNNKKLKKLYITECLYLSTLYERKYHTREDELDFSYEEYFVKEHYKKFFDKIKKATQN